MSDKPTRRGWLKGMLGALFGVWTARAAAEQKPTAGLPPPLAPLPHSFTDSSYSPGPTTTYVYDCVGGLTMTVDSPHATTVVYDALGRPSGPGEQTVLG